MNPEKADPETTTTCDERLGGLSDGAPVICKLPAGHSGDHRWEPDNWTYGLGVE